MSRRTARQLHDSRDVAGRHSATLNRWGNNPINKDNIWHREFKDFGY